MATGAVEAQGLDQVTLESASRFSDVADLGLGALEQGRALKSGHASDLPSPGCCGRSGSGGPPLAGLSCSCRNSLSGPSGAGRREGRSWAVVSGTTVSPRQPTTLLTSRMKNLAVFTLAQVFFSLETGLMFMPAGRGRASWGRLLRAAQASHSLGQEASVWPQLTQSLRLHPDQGLGLWQPRLSDGG